MKCMAQVPHRETENLEKSQRSPFRDKNLLYVQPATRCPIRYNRPYKKPTFKIESDTTYTGSYMKFDCIPRRRFDYGIHEKILAKNVTGKFDFDTIYKLSYRTSKEKVRRPFIPKSCLSISGCHDMTSIHMISYMNPRYTKVAPYIPYRGKVRHLVPMDRETVMKESYQGFGPIEVKRPLKQEIWQTKFKTDYQTTSQLSYQYIGSISKKACREPDRPIISAQIEKDTVTSTSYKILGHFIKQE